MDHITLADAIEGLVDDRTRAQRVRSAVVTAFSAGRTAIRRAGSTQPEAGLPRLIPSVPKPGDRVAVTSIGGAATVLGVISRAAVSLLDLGAPLVGQTYCTRTNSASADTTSWSDTGAYATAIALTWSDLPDGTYDIVVIGSLLAAHSGSAGVNCGVECAGSNSANAGVSCPASAAPHTRLERNFRFTNVVVAGGVTLRTTYKAASAGTVTVANPALVAIATRVS